MSESFYSFTEEHLETLRFTHEHGIVPINERRADLLLSFVCPPFDYTKKTITVLSDDGGVLKENKLHAEETGLRDDDKKFIVYYPNVKGVTNSRPTADELDDLMWKSIMLGEKKEL